MRKPTGSGCSRSMWATSTSRTVSRSNPDVAACSATSARTRSNVLHHFPLLEEILTFHAHGFSHQLEEVDDLERGCRFVSAELAMASMINADETVDTGGRRRVELPRMKFALIRWYRRQRVAHIANTWLTEIDQLHAGNCRENLCNAFGDPGHSRMFVQSDPLVNGMDKLRAKQLDPSGDVGDDMLQGKGGLCARHDDLAQLDIASGTPGEDAGSAGAGESRHRVTANSSGCLGIAGAILNDTAAVCRTAKDSVARADSIQDLQAEKRDMRRLKDIAAEIHDDIRRRFGIRAGGSGKPGKQVRGELDPGEHLHRFGHFLETGLAGGVAFLYGFPLVEVEAGRRQHEAGIDAVVAGRETTTRAGACLRPAGAPARCVSASTENVQYVADDGCRLPGVDSGRTGGGTDLHASCATGAAVEDFTHSKVERGDECVAAVNHSFTPSYR